MAINVRAQYNGGFFTNIIILHVDPILLTLGILFKSHIIKNICPYGRCPHANVFGDY